MKMDVFNIKFLKRFAAIVSRQLLFVKFRVFWDVAPCSQVEVDYSFNLTTRGYVSEDLNFILAAMRT
jgi:hypothetical protein